MTKNITLVRGDDTNFFNQTLLVVSFKTVLNLDGYKLRLTVENPTNIMKQFEVHNNTAEINFGKIDSSTFGIGEHKANLKLIDTLGRVKTMYLLNINVEDEFDASIDIFNEYEIEIELDTDGINKYKNYNELHNKPSINDVLLDGNKTFEDLGITEHISNISTTNIESHNTDIESHKDIREQLFNKQERLIAGANITIIDGIISSMGAEGGITTDYKHLGNKPKINGIVLDNDITLEELGVQQLGDYITEEMLLQKGFLTSVPSGYITEEELYAENYIKEVPPEYYTNAQNQEIYATKQDLDLKQNQLTAGDNIVINEEEGVTTISAQIPNEYIKKDELETFDYITSEYLNKKLDKKQNIMFAGDNIRIHNNTDGTYTISAIDSKNPKDVSSYNALNNKPTINGVALIGNKNSDELKLQPAGNYQNKLTAGDNIHLEDLADGTQLIKTIFPEDLCTDNELQQALETKADKANTLLGYRIEDAYTKEEVDNLVSDSFKNKVTDVILKAPNGTASYTETTVTAKAGLNILLSDGLNHDNTYNNIEISLDEDIILDVANIENKDLYTYFYFVLVYNAGLISTMLLPKNYYTTVTAEIIPNNILGYVKNIGNNKIYEMIPVDGIYTPKQIHIKIIGEGTSTVLEDNSLKITSFVPYATYKTINQDELLTQIKDLQHTITVGDNFKFENNKLEYIIPFNYVTKEFLIENDFSTQININDAINVHNLNKLSHQDIREEINNIHLNIPNKVSQLDNDNLYVSENKLELELKSYALLKDVQEQNQILMSKIQELENKINSLTE